MFKNWTLKDIFAALFISSLFVFCVWNFLIHNYDYDYEVESTIYYLYNPKYTQKVVDRNTKSLLRLIKDKKDKDYKELILTKVIYLQPDNRTQLKYAEELLSINMEHDPELIANIINIYLSEREYDKALDIAKHTKLAKDKCYKKSQVLGEVASCKANIHYLHFLQDWYFNAISCNIIKSKCNEAPIYQQYIEDINYTIDRQKLLERVYSGSYTKLNSK